jgi:hypothetical protein
MVSTIRNAATVLGLLVLGVALVATLTFLPSSHAGDANSKKSIKVPDDLQTAIVRMFPGLEVIEQKHVNVRSCGSYGADHPGWIVGDLNGDGLQDYAVLLFNKTPKDKKTFNGRVFSIHDFLLVALLKKADKTYHELRLHSFEDLVPTNKGLKRHNPGTAYDLELERNIRLEHFGITFYSCEQFAWAYHWNGEKFSRAIISR